MIKLAKPNITKLDKQSVLDALDSGWINTTGPYINKFESLLAETAQCTAATILANGTSAIFMALKALGIGKKAKVAIPSITFIATVNAVVHTGAEPIFFDCDKNLNIDPSEMEQYLKKSKIDCIIPVHIFGNPCNMEAINYLAKKHDIKVIEDACEALGSTYEGTPCGGLSDIGTFSFSFNKMITSGNGGAIVTNNKEWADKIRYWSKQSKDDPINYIHNEVGYNLGLTNIQAALGYSQLTRLKDILKEKQRIYEQYNQFLNDKIVNQPGSNHWFIGYCSSDRSKLSKNLEAKNIETRPLWKPNHLQKPYRTTKCFGKMTHSEYFGNTIINLPCGIDLTNEEIKDICDIIIKTEGR